MKKLALILVFLSLAGVGSRPAHAQDLDSAIEQIATHMLNDHPIKPPTNNLAVMQFTPARGPVRELGGYLMQKLRIRMFSLDKEKKVRFVSQGKVTDLIVGQGLKNLSIVYDDKQRVELGALLTADHLVYGTYEVFGDASAEIVSYLVEVKTGVTLAQAVRKVRGVPPHLLATGPGGQAPTGYAFSPSKERLKSDPKAAKQYRMVKIFRDRKRPEKSRQLLEGILKKYPNSLEAMIALLEIMLEDSAPLVRDMRFDEGFYSAVAGLPKAYKRGSRYNKLHLAVVSWLIALGDRELERGEDAASAQKFYKRAQNLGISESMRDDLAKKLLAANKEAADAGRAAGIRDKMRLGMMDEAELMLVEWEAEEPDSKLLARLLSEFARPKNMVTVPTGEVYGKQVRAFNLDRCEVTNDEFLEFVKGNAAYKKSRITPGLNDPDYLQRWDADERFDSEMKNIPVVFVSQKVAMVYCKWRGTRLPTNEEWGLAAGEGRRTYPWGNQKPDKEIANFNHNLFGDPMPCESHPRGKTPEGVYHMGGNVWESTSTLNESGKSIARGGSYFDQENILRNENRELSGDKRTYSSRFMGFRCAQ